MGNAMWSSLLHFHIEKTDIKYKVKVVIRIHWKPLRGPVCEG